MYSFKCLSLLLFTLFVLQCNESVKPVIKPGVDPQSALARGLKGRVQKVEYYSFKRNSKRLIDSMKTPHLDSILVFFGNGLLQTMQTKMGDCNYFYDNNKLILTITLNPDNANKAFYLKYYNKHKLVLTARGEIDGGQTNFRNVTTFNYTLGKIEEKTYWEEDSLLHKIVTRSITLLDAKTEPEEAYLKNMRLQVIMS